MKKCFISYFLIVVLIWSIVYPFNSYAFTRIVDLLFDGKSVEADKIQETLVTIKKNKLKNATIKNPAKLKPDKFIIVPARQKDPKNIQIEIDTSQSIVKSNEDIQAAISNPAFLNAVSEAITLWDNVDIADISFAPLKFASAQANPEDGRNIVTFRAIEAPEGVPDGVASVSIVTYARTDTIMYMNKITMVKPGVILDTDIIYDPTNNPCLALHTTGGTISPGGTNAAIVEGGIDPTLTADDLANCTTIQAGDLTDLAVRNIANLLGLESSAIASAASSPVAQIMTRYSLTNDDKLGLANLYPNPANLTMHGSVKGRVTLNKKPVRGAHVVFEDQTTGEPVVSTITDVAGRFKINPILEGTYNVYAEPLDGPIRKKAVPRNFFGVTADLNFTTGAFPTPVTIVNKKNIKLMIEVKELSASAFNINYLTGFLTEADVNNGGGGFFLPIKIMPGETLMDVQFWGSNINPAFGTLSVSGPGVTITNVREDKNVSISSIMSDPPPDVLPGLKVDINCAADAVIGPRNIIFTGDQVDMTNPSFGLRDQITGGLFVAQ